MFPASTVNLDEWNGARNLSCAVKGLGLDAIVIHASGVNKVGADTVARKYTTKRAKDSRNFCIAMMAL